MKEPKFKVGQKVYRIGPNLQIVAAIIKEAKIDNAADIVIYKIKGAGWLGEKHFYPSPEAIASDLINTFYKVPNAKKANQ